MPNCSIVDKMSDIYYVQNFYEDSSSKSNKKDNEPEVKKTRVNSIWLNTAKCQSPIEPYKAVWSKEIWKKALSKSTFEGVEVEYYSTGGQHRPDDCRYHLYSLYHFNNLLKVSMFKMDCKHDNYNDDHIGLSNDMRAFVKEKFDKGVCKPNSVIACNL